MRPAGCSCCASFALQTGHVFATIHPRPVRKLSVSHCRHAGARRERRFSPDWPERNLAAKAIDSRVQVLSLSFQSRIRSPGAWRPRCCRPVAIPGHFKIPLPRVPMRRMEKAKLSSWASSGRVFKFGRKRVLCAKTTPPMVKKRECAGKMPCKSFHQMGCLWQDKLIISSHAVTL